MNAGNCNSTLWANHRVEANAYLEFGSDYDEVFDDSCFAVDILYANSCAGWGDSCL
jgi:hypothetical protein